MKEKNFTLVQAWKSEDKRQTTNEIMKREDALRFMIPYMMILLPLNGNKWNASLQYIVFNFEKLTGSERSFHPGGKPHPPPPLGI